MILTDIKSKKEEAYELDIRENGVEVRANHPKGIYYALQTFAQLDIENKKVRRGYIIDEPAFSWRGFLVDVGRNYQPLEMLKTQLDVMARYKLNILHFHFTEDLAWRLESKRFPGLTEPDVMEREVLHTRRISSVDRLCERKTYFNIT